MNLPELKDVAIRKVEEIGERIALYVSLERTSMSCLLKSGL